jgi:hypothetical protein
VGGHTITSPAQIRHGLTGSLRPILEIESARLDGVAHGGVIQMYSDELGNQAVSLIAPNLSLDGELFGVGGTGTLDLSNLTQVRFHDSQLLFDSNGKLTYTVSTPAGNATFRQGRGIIASMYYTGGTGATSAGAGEAALPAWTGADAVRFLDGRKYSAEIGGGAFTSTASPSPAEVAAVRLRSAVNSVAAQVLGSLQVATPAGPSVQSFMRRIYFKNISGATIDKTSLGLTVARVAGVGNASTVRQRRTRSDRSAVLHRA